VTSFIGDEGRPFEVGFQKQASNHFKWLSLREMVISVEVKVQVINLAGVDQRAE
jgi:hypothetical protein